MKRIKAKSAVALFLSGAIMMGGLSLVMAREDEPVYQVPDLMLTQEQAVYDLCDDIQFDGSKYDLSVYDQGAFDINATGSNTVKYLLTPVEQPSTSGPVDTVSLAPGRQRLPRRARIPPCLK